jgi:hypothetical protein
MEIRFIKAEDRGHRSTNYFYCANCNRDLFDAARVIEAVYVGAEYNEYTYICLDCFDKIAKEVAEFKQQL